MSGTAFNSDPIAKLYPIQTLHTRIWYPSTRAQE